MKKLTALFIIIIFAISLVFINYYGLNYRADQYNPVESMELYDVSLSEGLEFVKDKKFEIREDGKTYIQINFDRTYRERVGKQQLMILTIQFYPDYATNKNLIYTLNGSGYHIEETTLVPTLIFDADFDKTYDTAQREFICSNVTTKGRINLNIVLVINIVDEELSK